MPLKLEQRLWRLAQRAASVLYLDFTPDCSRLVHELIAAGVEQMEFEHVAERKDKIEKAEQNLERFVRKMAEESLRLGRLPKLDEQTFKAALKLCPLWPFCWE